MRRARVPSLLAALPCALATLAASAIACSMLTPAGAATLPRDGTRRAVERLVHATYPDLAFGNIACPDTAPRRRGTTFSCTVQLPGAFLVIDGTVADGAGTVTFAAAQAVLPKAQLEQFVAGNTSLPATVDCGPAPFRVARPSQVVSCTAALADGTHRTVQLTVADTAGTVTITGVV